MARLPPQRPLDAKSLCRYLLTPLAAQRNLMLPGCHPHPTSLATSVCAEPFQSNISEHAAWTGSYYPLLSKPPSPAG